MYKRFLLIYSFENVSFLRNHETGKTPSWLVADALQKTAFENLENFAGVLQVS